MKEKISSEAGTSAKGEVQLQQMTSLGEIIKDTRVEGEGVQKKRNCVEMSKADPSALPRRWAEGESSGRKGSRGNVMKTRGKRPERI